MRSKFAKLFRVLFSFTLLFIAATGADATTAIQGDLNSDGMVNWGDIKIFSDVWWLKIDCPSSYLNETIVWCGGSEVTGANGRVDLQDFALFANNWLDFQTSLPGKAYGPIPVNASPDGGQEANLTWLTGYGTTSHDIYFGTANPPPFARNQTGNMYRPGTLAWNKTYYWRINEKNSYGTATGDVWSFKTVSQPDTAGLIFTDSPSDLTNTHPRLLIKGYGTDNGMWAKMQTDSRYDFIWNNIARNYGTGRGYPALLAAAGYILSKQEVYGRKCRDIVLGDTGDWRTGPDAAGYALAYDAIVDDPSPPDGIPWLDAADKAEALQKMEAVALDLLPPAHLTNWHLKPTHNYFASIFANITACTYNLRGEPGYEQSYEICRQASLNYMNDRINGLCGGALSNEGPRTADGFPMEGPQYGPYNVSRGQAGNYIIEMSEYPNPPQVRDDNLSGFFQNYLRAWMALMPGGVNSDWAQVIRVGAYHGVLSGFRLASHLNWAAGDQTMARVGEWFYSQVISNGMFDGDDLFGFEAIWFNPAITPLNPADAGFPLYTHLNDSEFHMYRTSWELVNPPPGDTYVYFRNSPHDGHAYWNEGHSDGTAGPCTAQTSSHVSADNGHFCVYKDKNYVISYDTNEGDTHHNNCIQIDGHDGVMMGNAEAAGRAYSFPQFADVDCIGAVDSDYGHAIDAIVGPVYNHYGQNDVLRDPLSYHRYFFVIRDPMYILVVDELETGHEITFYCYAMTASKREVDQWADQTNRMELLYPQSGYTTGSGARPITITTTSPQLMFMCHTAADVTSFSKSMVDGDMISNIGSDTLIYNPDGSTYAHGSISGNAKVFIERTGGALIFKATNAMGSQYGVNCNTQVNVSINGDKASICAYGTGTKRVAVTSPAGGDVFYVTAGQTVEKTLTGASGTDILPPTPDPLTWAVPPAAASSSSITMTAVTATDTSGPVEYYFENSPTGSIHSTWQTETNWTATGLASETTYTFRVRARDGASPIPNETDWSATADATTPDATLPAVSVIATDAAAAEPGDAGQFTVTRSISGSAKTIYYSVSGTATAGADYQSLSGSVVIANGATTATIAVAPINDTLLESNETVILTITANAGYTIGSPSSATVTIADDDAPVCEDPGFTALTCDSFESGWGSYTASGTTATVNCAGGNHATNGTCVANIENSSGSFAHTSGLDLTSYKQLKVKFDFYASTNVGTGEGFKVEYYDGTAWQLLKQFVKGADLTVGTQYTNVEIYAYEGIQNFPANAKIRFTNVGNSTSDDIFIDYIRVMASADLATYSLFSDGFEVNGIIAGDWTTDSTSNVGTSGTKYTGSVGGKITKTSWLQKAISTAGTNNIHLKYVRKNGLDSGETSYVEWSTDGASWNVVDTVAYNENWVVKDITCASGAADNAGFRFRFRCNSTNGDGDQMSVDDVSVTGTQLP